MKIIANIPCWKRPEVLRLMIQYIPQWLEPVFCVSPEDPHVDELVSTIQLYGYDVVSAPNEPLGLKQNKLIKYIVQNKDFDYMMHLGSDDIINPNILSLYLPYMSRGVDFFGIGDVYFWKYGSDKMQLLENYNDKHAIGGARMISRRLLDQCGDIYPDHVCCGMDNHSREVIKQKSGVDDVLIKAGDPMLVDIKTNTNINPLQMFPDSMRNRFKEIEADHVLKHFKKTINPDIMTNLNDKDGFFAIFEQYKDNFEKEQNCFDWLNITYAELFGVPKYSNYDAFRVRKHKYLKKVRNNL